MEMNPEKVYDKFCICTDRMIAPNSLYVCRCRIDSQMNKYRACIETVDGISAYIYNEDIYDTMEEALKARENLLNDWMKAT